MCEVALHAVTCMQHACTCMCRQAAEQRMSEVAEEMEKLLSKHAEELEQISDQLLSQKELSTKYSMRVLELEKDIRIKALNHKETQKELSTEKAVSSKFYDEVRKIAAFISYY